MSTRHIVTLLLFVAFLNFFFFQPVGAMGIGLILVGLLAFIAWYFLPETKRHPKTVAVAGTATVLLALIRLNRANESTNVILILGALAILFCLFYLLVNDLPSFRAISEFLTLPIRTGWRYIKSIFPGLRALGQTSDSEKVNKHLSKLPLKSLLIGLVVSFPVLIILVQLLSAADPIFKHTIEESFSADTLDRIVKHVIISLVLFFGALPLLNITYKPFKSPLRFLRSQNYATEYSVVMTMVAAVLLLFVGLQWRYIFMPSVKGVNLSQFGFDTYSAYVQKGFNEFITATLFVFSLLWIGLVALHQRGKKSYLLAVQLIVLAEFGLVLAAFFRRIWLYQYWHGMTLVRFYGGYFAAVIGLFALTLLGRHLWERRWIVVESVIAAAAIVGLGLFNIEHYIAMYHPPTVNERVDYTYLSRLSADGYECWKKAFAWTEQVYGDIDKTSSFSAEQRRQLAYSGVVTQQILGHYEELVNRFGTEDEKRAYTAAVLTQLETQIQSRIDAIDYKLATSQFPAEPTTSGGMQPDPQSMIQVYEYNKDHLLQLKNDLAATRNDLSKSPKDRARHLSFSRYGGRPLSQSFQSDTNCTLFADCEYQMYSLSGTARNIPLSWYTLIEGGDEPEKTTWDKILDYNVRKAGVYERMKTEITMEKLVEYQKRYFDSHLKVLNSAQTADDRQFDADLSLRTPFLESIGYDYMY